jgi:hypothetical protein
MPANCGLFVRDRETSVRIGLRGGRCSQLRTSLHTKFPANREFNREFRKFRASAAISASNQRVNSKACRQIPYAMEQGIFAAITGNFFRITGNLIERAAKSAELLSDVELAPLFLPKTRFERIDGVGRRGSDTQQSLRTARWGGNRARPSQPKRELASHYNGRCIS